MDLRISVIVPMRNESANVLPLTQKIFSALATESGRFELILVDDASTDDTWSRILEAWRTYPQVRPYRHTQHSGQSAALWMGFCQARGPILATLDGDLQNDPADLPRMIEELASCDMVCGLRAQRADNLLRRISSRVARQARKWVLGIDFADSACNLKVFSREVLTSLPAFDGLHRFMPILAQNAGLAVRVIPVSHHPRVAGKSKYGIRNRLVRGVLDLIMVRLYLNRQIRKVPLETSLAESGGATTPIEANRPAILRNNDQEPNVIRK